MSELEKYKLVKVFGDIDEFMDKVNALVELGYKVNTYISEYEQGEHLGIGEHRREALMSLSSSTKYDDISNLKDVDPRDVDDYLATNWIVADSYSKFLRMVKKK